MWNSNSSADTSMILQEKTEGIGYFKMFLYWNSPAPLVLNNHLNPSVVKIMSCNCDFVL